MLIEKILDVFSFGKLQDTVTILTLLKQNNITISRFIEFVEEKKIESVKLNKEKKELEEKGRDEWREIALRCPQCQEVMGLLSVNTQPGDQTGDDSKSVWLCTNINCSETIYSKKTIKEILKERRK